MPKLTEVCEQAARAGGQLLTRRRDEFEVQEKAPDDLVTEFDLASQRAIVDVIQKAYPDHGILAEESLNQPPGEDGFRWIIDPLDGTLNFVHGLPTYSVSIAVEQNGQILVGVVFDPVSGECFTASRGGGAYRNDRPIRVSSTESLTKSLVATSFPTNVGRDAIEIEQFIEAVVRCRGIRRLGSAALNLAYLASGHFDAYWATETHAWDIAAGMLLVQEAGGCFTGLSGEPIDLDRPQFIAAATDRLHAEVLEMLQSVGNR